VLVVSCGVSMASVLRWAVLEPSCGCHRKAVRAHCFLLVGLCAPAAPFRSTSETAFLLIPVFVVELCESGVASKGHSDGLSFPRTWHQAEPPGHGFSTNSFFQTRYKLELSGTAEMRDWEAAGAVAALSTVAAPPHRAAAFQLFPFFLLF